MTTLSRPARSPNLRAADVAARLGVHPNTVLAYARAGLLGCRRVGGDPRFSEADVERYLAGQRPEEAGLDRAAVKALLLELLPEVLPQALRETLAAALTPKE